MSDEQHGRELTPRERDELETGASPLTPVEGDRRDVERFTAAPQVHSVELTEERGAQIVRQSANARNVVFLAILIIALFIPVYWFYENGIPAVGAEGRLAAEADAQYVTDVARGYELYLANCAECHGEQGQGGVGPPLNDQAKLYNVVTPAGLPGSGHLNPVYLDRVLTVGGRYICGDPNSLMLAFKEPNGPLNYRQVEELIAWLTASNEIVFEHEPGGHGEGDAEGHEAEMVAGWRDPNWEPEPGATPPPACWKNPSGVIGGGAAPAPAPTPEPGVTPEPIDGGTPDEPRVYRFDATADLKFKDEAGTIVPQIEVVPGETIQFEIDNVSNFDHNFWIGAAEELEVFNAETDVGIPTWQSGVETYTWTVPSPDEAPPDLQFGCTIPGHYAAGMFGDIVIQQ